MHTCCLLLCTRVMHTRYALHWVLTTSFLEQSLEHGVACQGFRWQHRGIPRCGICLRTRRGHVPRRRSLDGLQALGKDVEIARQLLLSLCPVRTAAAAAAFEHLLTAIQRW